MHRTWTGLWAGLALTLAAIASAGAQQPAAEFYKDKTISILIGFGPGGGNDTWSRLLARHMGRHIPGTPLIVPQNLPGGGGLLVANQLYNVSPKDGTVIGAISRGIPLEPLFGGQGTRFDAQKLTWIGSPDRDTAICVARTDTGIASIKDLYQRELIMGATGSGTDSAIYPDFMAVLFGLKLKTVKGYKGSNEMQLAIERNEVQGMCGSHDSIMASKLGRDGKLTILFQGRLSPDPRLKGVAYFADIARTDEERQVFELFLTRSALGRPLVAPPGLPPERTATLRRAFNATMTDKAFLEEAAKQSLSAEPMTGEELLATIERAHSKPPEIIKRTTEVLGRLAGEKAK